MNDLEVNDTLVDENDAKARELRVKFQAYENIQDLTDVLESAGKEFESVKQTASRPTLSEQVLSPSDYLNTFQSSLAVYTKHRCTFCYA